MNTIRRFALPRGPVGAESCAEPEKRERLDCINDANRRLKAKLRQPF
jgi:hypothetical protein